MRDICILKCNQRDGYLKLNDKHNNFTLMFPINEIHTVIKAIDVAMGDFNSTHESDYDLESSKILRDHNRYCKSDSRIYSNWIRKRRASKILTSLSDYLATHMDKICKSYEDKISKKEFIKSLPAKILVGLYNNKKGEKNEESSS